MTVVHTTKCENCGAEMFPEEESKLVFEDEDAENPLLESKIICERCIRDGRWRWRG
jgi:hypothetical protein